MSPNACTQCSVFRGAIIRPRTFSCRICPAGLSASRTKGPGRSRSSSLGREMKGEEGQAGKAENLDPTMLRIF